MILNTKVLLKIFIICIISVSFFLGYFLRENAVGGGLEFYAMEWPIIQSLKKDFLFTINNYGLMHDYTMPFPHMMNAYLNPFSDNITNFQLANTIISFLIFIIFAIVLKKKNLHINFVDILGHSRTESEILQEIIPDASAYRNAICAWMGNAWLMDMLQVLSNWGHTVFLTSDHGSIQVSKPVKVIGDKKTSTGIRYKYGKNLNVPEKYGFQIQQPERFKLPKHEINTNYLIASGDSFFIYPNEYNKYVHYYMNSFQHGGISLEEMVVPIATLRARKR